MPQYGWCMAVETIRGDMGWSTFRERLAMAVLRYRVRLKRMDECKWAKVYEWNMYGQCTQEYQGKWSTEMLAD